MLNYFRSGIIYSLGAFLAGNIEIFVCLIIFMPAFIYQHLLIKQILSYYNKEYKDKLNLWESIKNLTRTYVCGMILGRKVNLFKNDDMAEFFLSVVCLL